MVSALGLTRGQSHIVRFQPESWRGDKSSPLLVHRCKSSCGGSSCLQRPARTGRRPGKRKAGHASGRWELLRDEAVLQGRGKVTPYRVKNRGWHCRKARHAVAHARSSCQGAGQDAAASRSTSESPAHSCRADYRTMTSSGQTSMIFPGHMISSGRWKPLSGIMIFCLRMILSGKRNPLSGIMR